MTAASSEKPDDTTAVQPVDTPTPARPGKIKLAFMYVLIGGLVVSALVSIAAILVGEFNDVIQKALWTTVIFVSHSLLILTLVSADRHNQIGRSLLPTVILGVILANMVTTTFGTWDILKDDLAWRLVGVYTLLIGSSFLVTAVQKLRLRHTTTLAAAYSTLGLIGLWTLLLMPWILIDIKLLDDFYFRLVGAATILTATALAVTVIIRRIALAQTPELRDTKPAREPLSGGMLAVLITVGSLTAFVWFIGFFAFIVSAVNS